MAAVLTILVALAIPEYPKWMAKADQARCMGNMRSLHVGLSGYLNDHQNIWPQGPSPEQADQWAQFWVGTLEKQGIPASTWECRTIRRMLDNPPQKPISASVVHYLPTMFDDLPGTARRWPTQPWLVERADAHGNGALLCFTDGSIKPFNKVLAEMGYR